MIAMSGRHHERSREALSRLPTLDLGELRELWCRFYKTETTPRLSRELLVRAVRIVKLTATSEKGMKRSKRSHCGDRVAPLVGCLGSEDPQRGA